MYAIRSYYEIIQEAGCPYKPQSQRGFTVKKLIAAWVISISLAALAGGTAWAEEDEEMKSLKKLCEEKNRITSYNVCYTKLLRPDGGKRIACTRKAGLRPWEGGGRPPIIRLV